MITQRAFGNVWGGVSDPNALNGAANNETYAVSIASRKGIPGASYQTCLFKPLSGILSQRKKLPLCYLPITVELSLVDDQLDRIIPNFNNYAAGGVTASEFTNVNTSTTWQIQHVQVQCDLFTLDSGLNESYIKLLGECKKFTLNYNTFVSQYQPIINQTDSLSTARGH